MLEQAATIDPERRRDAVQRRAADLRREPAGALLRGAAAVLRAQRAAAAASCRRCCGRRCCGTPTAERGAMTSPLRRHGDYVRASHGSVPRMRRLLLRAACWSLVVSSARRCAAADAAGAGRRHRAARAVCDAPTEIARHARAVRSRSQPGRSSGRCGSARAVRFDFGDSFLYNRPVARAARPRRPPTPRSLAVVGARARDAARHSARHLHRQPARRLPPALVRGVSLVCLSLPPLLTSLLLVFIAATHAAGCRPAA